MNKKKFISMMLALLMVFAVFTGCGQYTTVENTTTTAEKTTTTIEKTEATTEPAADITEAESDVLSFMDMKGREIKLNDTAKRIVALTAADCEILYAIGAGETLVGRGEYCDYPAEVLDAPAVQSGNETNIEQIIALEPDIILMGTMAQTQEQIDALENAGILVVVSDAQDINGIYTAIELIGKATGQNDNAADLIAKMKTDFAEIKAAAEEKSTADSKSVYFEVSPLEWGLWAAGKDTFMHEAAEMIGLENTFADVNQWGEISQEQVIERNPDYIVTITMYFGEGPLPEEEIMSRDGWASITAVSEKQVFNANSDELSRPGPRLVDGVKSLFDFVYGE